MRFSIRVLLIIYLSFSLPGALIAGLTLKSEVGALYYNEHEPRSDVYPVSLDILSDGWILDSDLYYSFDLRLGTHDYFQDNQEIELIEAFVEHPLFGGDLSAGRLLIPWGRADQINPTDSLVTRNYQFRTFEDSNQFIGNDGIAYHRAFYDVDIEMVWMINLESSRLPSIDFLNELDYVKNYSSNNFGIRGDYSANRIDAGISFYQGLNLMPSYLFEPNKDPIAQFVNYRVRRVGVDSAVNLGKSTARLEFAHMKSLGNDDQISSALYGQPREDIRGVIGIDRNLKNNWYINFQLLGQWLLEKYPGFVGPASGLNQVISTQRLVNRQPEDELYGITWRISKTLLQDTLMLELSGLAYTRDQGSLWRPRVEYQLSDTNSLTLGGDQYFGDEFGLLGVLQPNNSVWFLQWKFNQSIF